MQEAGVYHTVIVNKTLWLAVLSLKQKNSISIFDFAGS